MPNRVLLSSRNAPLLSRQRLVFGRGGEEVGCLVGLRDVLEQRLCRRRPGALRNIVLREDALRRAAAARRCNNGSPGVTL